MTITHNGKIIPTADPKDLDSDVWYGFTYPLKSGETISSSSWLIDGTAVNPSDTINGLTFEASSLSGTECQANLSGGTAGVKYCVTNRISTNLTPSDDRSFNLHIVAKL